MHNKAALLGSIFFVCFLVSSYIGVPASLVCFGVFAAGAAIVRFAFKNKSAFPVLAGISAAFLYFAAYSSVFILPVTRLYGETLDIVGTVQSVTFPENDRTYVTVSANVNGTDVRFSFACPDIDAKTGDTLEARVKFSEPLITASYSGNYNYSRGIFVRASAQYADIISKQSGFSPRSALSDYSAYLRETIRETLPNEEGALMLAMCFGDKSRLSEELSASVAGSGLSHMTAVSGMHISVIVSSIMAALKATELKKHKVIRFAAVVILTAVFMVFFDFSASVCRSGLMMIACYGACIFRRKPAPVSSLGAAVLVILLAEPCACRDTGLILSACGTFGAVYAAPKVGEYIGRSVRVPEKADILIVGICASLFTLPVSALTFGRISLLSAFSSAAVYLPFLGIMILAIIFAFSGGFLSSLVLLPAGVLLKIMCAVMRLFSGFRYSSIPVDGERLVPFMTAAAVFIALVVPIAARSRHKRRYIAVTASVCICTFAALLTAHKVADKDITKISVFSDGQHFLAAIENDSGISAFSSEINGKLSSAAYSALTRRGADSLDLLCVLTEKKHIEMYSHTFDSIPAKRKCYPRDAGNAFDISGRYTAYVYADRVAVEINGVGVIFASASDAPAHGGYDIAVYSGYKKDPCISRNGITVLCSKRYTGTENAYNAYYSNTEIRISKDGKVLVKQK